MLTPRSREREAAILLLGRLATPPFPRLRDCFLLPLPPWPFVDPLTLWFAAQFSLDLGANELLFVSCIVGLSPTVTVLVE